MFNYVLLLLRSLSALQCIVKTCYAFCWNFMSAIVKCLLFVQSSISGSAFSVGCQASTCTVSLIFKHWNGFVVSVLLVWIVVSFYRFTDSLLTQI